MRVAHVTPVFPPYRGGMGTVAYQQAQALAESGIEVTVLTPRKTPPRTHPPGVTVLELPAPLSKGNAAFLPQVVRRTSGFDLVHLHYPFFGTAELLAARRLSGGPPLVVQYQMDVIGRGWCAVAFRWHRRSLLRLVLRAADAVIVTSEDYAASSFLAQLLPGLRSRLVVVPPGVDLDVLSPNGERDIHRRHFGAAVGPVIFFLARLDRQHYFKGLQVLLEALRRLPEVRLLVGGDGDLRSRYEAEARRLGVEGRVCFTGDVPDALLPAYYRAADAVVLPSIDRTEAFGMVLLEAMACGTPVVASNLPGVRALVEDGRTGFLAAPGDAGDLAEKIVRCIRNRSALGAAAREHAAARYGWATVAERLLELYHTLTPAAPQPLSRPSAPKQRSVAGFL